MSRIVPLDVKRIIDTTPLNDTDDAILNAFIEDAHNLVTEILGSDTTLSDNQKATIEKWLTAHLLASTRLQQAQRERAGEAEITYQGKTGTGLESTMYGQQVLMLDSTGKIAQNIGKKRVLVKAVTSFE